MWYTPRYETTYLYPTSNRGRTAPDPGGITFIRCLRVAPLPNLTGFGAERTRPRDRAPIGLRRTDRAQPDPRLQFGGPIRLSRSLLSSPSVVPRLTSALSLHRASMTPSLLVT